MHHVVGKEQGNFQAAEIHHLVLHLADILAGDGIKDGAYLPVFDHLADGLFRVIRADADQTQLADFLIDRHFLEQFRDKRIPRFRRERVIAKQILCQRRLQRQADGDTYRT